MGDRLDVPSVATELHTAVAPFFASKGFAARKANRFERRVSDLTHIIALPPFRRAEGPIVTSVGCGIRVEPVEVLRRRDEDSGDSVTVGEPLHLLRPDKELRYWVFEKIADITANAQEITAEIEKYALPYLDRFTSSDVIYDIVKADQRPYPFNCQPGERDALMVYFTFLRKGLAAAEQVAEDLLERVQNEQRKRRRHLETALQDVRRHARL